MKKEIKHIFIVENGEIEFKNEKELLRYFKGEKPELKLIEKDRYKAIFNSK